ncbi:glycoside hydrolase family 71/99-like protein [Aporhodopirellula aestuarii]|uniref:Glycoside hydrolase family 71/99-like protein n=1 Tax=Aporhodopirellula aestuarii TaxID=2950107 RepID=A0ABT0U265_9BACT|nr:glycoside hydrolase family 71/99-like protein [Aporhodopirellula aestuarii]MCM2370967.1 glycoside hydrolase family 71/99-like protein [Aporhodopirellula aestuarii]
MSVRFTVPVDAPLCSFFFFAFAIVFVGQLDGQELSTPERAAKASSIVDTSTLSGKVMVGYQGWFNADGDGSNLGWTHWAQNRNKPFGPGNVTVDLWPDMTEYDQDERYPTEFQLADGSVAEVFSSANPKTIHRHFRWMQEYDIDGAFVQRFASGLSSQHAREHKNAVLQHAIHESKRYGRVCAVMYDLSGLKEGQLVRVYQDWSTLQSQWKLTDASSYLYHNDKPLVAIWGVGFTDRHVPGAYTLAECRDMIESFKSAGCSVILGVPTGWREQNRDAVTDTDLHEILKLADVISPWTPGRYRTLEQVAKHERETWTPDVKWCEEQHLDLLPVVFPGFSWHNLKGEPLDAIPRLKGQFLWSQIVAAKQAGADMIYVAMFDEVDEGTAIFKCTNEPPVGEGVRFLTYEGLPSDHYLKLVGKAGLILRNEVPASNEIPAMR